MTVADEDGTEPALDLDDRHSSACTRSCRNRRVADPLMASMRSVTDAAPRCQDSLTRFVLGPPDFIWMDFLMMAVWGRRPAAVPC